MGNKQSLSQADVQAMETGDRRLGEARDPMVKKMAKRLEAMKQDVLTKGPPDVKGLFDQLAEGGKISKANFSILMRGTLNFAIKNAMCSQGGAPAVHASKKDAIANIERTCQAGAEATGLNTIAVTAALVKAVDRLDLHSTKILDRAFDVLDADGNGFLEFSEIEAFMGKLMSDPMSAVDPFAFIGGSGADKVSMSQVSELLCDIFAFLADMQIQVMDVVDDVFTSHDVLRAIESDNMIWSQLFGLAGGQDKITMKQFKAFLAQAPWEMINGQYLQQMTSPPFAAMMAHNNAQLAELKQDLLSGISETGSAEAGMARAYAWLKNGIDETTFMSSVLPSFRKFVKEKMEPKELAKNYAKTIGLAFADLKETKNDDNVPAEVQQMFAQAGPILDMIAAQVSQEGFLEGIFTQPAVASVIEKYAAAYQAKLPIILHHAFRFCDINSDGGVSDKELKVLFALKDAMANGKIDEAAVHIFEVLDKDGNGELCPGEICAFFAKCLSLFTATQRIVVSLVFETLLPEITKVALPMVASAAGVNEISKETLPGLMMMAQMGMMQAGMGMAMMQAETMEAPSVGPMDPMAGTKKAARNYYKAIQDAALVSKFPLHGPKMSAADVTTAIGALQKGYNEACNEAGFSVLPVLARKNPPACFNGTEGKAEKLYIALNIEAMNESRANAILSAFWKTVDTAEQAVEMFDHSFEAKLASI